MTVQELINSLEKMVIDDMSVADIEIRKVMFGKSFVQSIDEPRLAEYNYNIDDYFEDTDNPNVVLI